MDEIDEGVLYKRYEEFLLSESRRYFEPKTEVGKRDFIEYLRFCRKRHEKELEIAEEYLQVNYFIFFVNLFFILLTSTHSISMQNLFLFYFLSFL